jgi:hypothetical protein
MTAKHHAPHPKRRQKPDDLEKRVRRIERNYMREIVKTATHIARHEANRAIREHEAGDTVSWPSVAGAVSYNIYGKTPTEVIKEADPMGIVDAKAVAEAMVAIPPNRRPSRGILIQRVEWSPERPDRALITASNPWPDDLGAGML